MFCSQGCMHEYFEMYKDRILAMVGEQGKQGSLCALAEGDQRAVRATSKNGRLHLREERRPHRRVAEPHGRMDSERHTGRR